MEDYFRINAHGVFQWLCYSVPPIRLAEMVEVLASKPDINDSQARSKDILCSKDAELAKC